MAPDYYEAKTKAQERLGCEFLKELGHIVEPNNEIDLTDIDYVMPDGRLIDFQFSENFQKYGDLRIDLISAYRQGGGNRWALQDKIASEANRLNESSDIKHEISKILTVDKWGKYFEENGLSAVLYFMYNNRCGAGIAPDKILFVSAESVRDFVRKNWVRLARRKMIRLNEKRHLGDIHGSGFICVNYSDLAAALTIKRTIKSAVFGQNIELDICENL